MDDLIVWFRAQLDEDERTVRAYVAALPSIPASMVPDSDLEGVYGEFERRFSDPDAALADIAAKRAILDAHERAWRLVYRSDQPAEHAAERAWTTAVRLLASAYADRPGYREEWRP